MRRWIEVSGRRAGRLGTGEDLLGGDQEVDVVQLIGLGWVHLLAPGHHHALAILRYPTRPLRPARPARRSSKRIPILHFACQKTGDRMTGMSRFTSYGIC